MNLTNYIGNGLKYGRNGLNYGRNRLNYGRIGLKYGKNVLKYGRNGLKYGRNGQTKYSKRDSANLDCYEYFFFAFLTGGKRGKSPEDALIELKLYSRVFQSIILNRILEIVRRL
jgi:hypothetical protein